jgi:hypothetical protein
MYRSGLADNDHQSGSSQTVYPATKPRHVEPHTPSFREIRTAIQKTASAVSSKSSEEDDITPRAVAISTFAPSISTITPSLGENALPVADAVLTNEIEDVGQHTGFGRTPPQVGASK